MHLHPALIALLTLLALGATLPAVAHDTTAPMAHHAHEAVAQIGDIAIAGAFSRATLPNAPVGGGFLTITNNGDSDDTLVSASAPVARETQLHEMSMDGTVMRMRELEGGIPIAAGETVTLAPGGLHIMFMGLTGPIVEGETIPVTLTFEKAGTITIEMPVGPAAAGGPSHDQHGDCAPHLAPASEDAA